MKQKVTKRFVCQECGNIELRWSGRCPACGNWNSLLEENTSPTQAGATPGIKLATKDVASLSKVKPAARLDSGIAEVNQVLGGGIVPGSIVLLAGEPGIGKSTLLLEIANGVAQKHAVLYVSGEESLEQLQLRAKRLKVDSANLQMATSVNADDVVATIESGNFSLLIVDSIQTMATSAASTAAGTISQITASAQALLRAAKTSNCAIIVAGHVTKEGNIAGPKILEHVVDAVAYLEGERTSQLKLLKSIKNRFGSTNETGIFEMVEKGLIPVANPSQAFLDERQAADGSVVLATVEGNRALLVEVQALVTPSPFGYPKRTTTGFDLNRLNLLLAVLHKRANLHLGQHDVYVNIVGGLKVTEPAADLAVALAVASAAKAKTVIDSVVFGEVGLSGEIRSVAQAAKRLAEAKKLNFKNVIAPASAKPSLPAKTLAQAIQIGLK